MELWDRAVFRVINGELTHPILDSILPWMRISNHWLPLYLFLLVFATINFKARGLWWFIFFVSTIALTDMIGTYVFKHNIQRLRPCNDPEFFMHVRLVLDRCAAGYSFISNHAANHFGMATFFYLTFRNILPRVAWIGFAWAAIVAYAQVYIGIHYPLDILAGILLGILVGHLTSRLFNKRFGFAIFDNQPMAVS